MIRFIKDEPFVAPMVLCALVTVIAAFVCLVEAIISPDNGRNCNNGYVYVNSDQAKGCVSEQTWKDMQK